MQAYLKTVGTVQASYVIRKVRLTFHLFARPARRLGRSRSLALSSSPQFLDAQRLTHLTSYLQELHSRGLANSDITTLLLNCYTKLADDEALSRFIHSSSTSASTSPSSSSTSTSPSHSSDEPPFDLDTAIRVLRQAGYFAHATWLAQRYRAHGAYLRIAIEDSGDCVGALRYVRELARDDGAGEGPGERERAASARDEARESLARWGGVLLQREPELTTEVLVEVCCGVETPAPAREGEIKQGSKDSVSKDRVGALKHGRAASGAKAFDVPDSASIGGASSLDGAPGPFAAEPDPTSSSSLPSPRSFFAHFVDRPRHFISFLEQVVARRYGKPVDSLVAPSSLTGADAPLPAPRTLDVDVPRDAAARDEQVVWNTLLELYISASSASLSASSSSSGGLSAVDERERVRLQGMALRLLRCRDQVPYDETQALLVCTTQGFEEGFVLLYELLGMYEDIVRCASLSLSLSHTTLRDRDLTRALPQTGSTPPPRRRRRPTTRPASCAPCAGTARPARRCTPSSCGTSQRRRTSSRGTRPTCSTCSTRSTATRSCRRSRSCSSSAPTATRASGSCASTSSGSSSPRSRSLTRCVVAPPALSSSHEPLPDPHSRSLSLARRTRP